MAENGQRRERSLPCPLVDDGFCRHEPSADTRHIGIALPTAIGNFVWYSTTPPNRVDVESFERSQRAEHSCSPVARRQPRRLARPSPTPLLRTTRMPGRTRAGRGTRPTPSTPTPTMGGPGIVPTIAPLDLTKGGRGNRLLTDETPSGSRFVVGHRSTRRTPCAVGKNALSPCVAIM